MSAQVKPTIGVMRMQTVIILMENTPAHVRLVTKAMNSLVKVKHS